MPFSYSGFESLEDFEVFAKLYSSAVQDTAREFGFIAPLDLTDVSVRSRRALQRAHHHFIAILHDKISDGTQVSYFGFKLGLVGLAIHSVSLHRVLERPDLTFQNGVVDINRSALALRNPSELIALTFGVGLYEIEHEFNKSNGSVLDAPVPVRLKLVSFDRINGAVLRIAETRNHDLSANNGQYHRSLLLLMRIIYSLHPRRHGYGRRGKPSM